MRALVVVLIALLVGCVPTPTPTARPSLNSPTATATPTSSPTLVPTAAPTTPPAAEIESQLGEPGILTVCLSVVGAPATGLNEQGQLVGYNVAIADELAERLGLALATQEPQFDTLIDLVRDHQCDISVSSQNITSERLELVDFVIYTESIQPVLVARDNPTHINTLTDLCGKPVSATEGTTHVDLVNGTGDFVRHGLNEACETVDQPPIDLRTFETESHAVTALLQGDVVAYLGNSGFAFEFSDQIDYSAATLPPARQGITIARDRPILRTAIEAILAQVMDDGTYRAILIQHLPNDESVRIVSILE